jgi:hypothetical protein
MKKYFKYIIYLYAAYGFSVALAGSFEDFFRAVSVDDAWAVQGLLARGFDPNAVNENGQSGLLLALREDSPKVAAALLAHPGTRIDAANANDETPLMMAALHGQIDWVQRLIDRGARIDKSGWAPLHYAASGPEPKVVALLIARGAQIDALSPNHTTPLMMAARYGTEEAAELLLAQGASPRVRNQRGLDAADFARLGGREKLAARLDAAARPGPARAGAASSP